MYRTVQRDLSEILSLFDLQDAGDGGFLGPQPDHPGLFRVYGGQVAAQAIAAAARTVTGRRLHSLHVAFLRPGDPTAPLHYGVATLREGRTFSTRRVTVSQQGRPIMEALVSFLEPIDGDDFQQVMSPGPQPEGLPSLPEQLREHLGSGIRDYLGPVQLGIVELRYIDPPPRIAIDAPPPEEALCRLWIRLVGEMPQQVLDDPVTAACMLAYISDWTVLDPVQVAIGKTWHEMASMASLDHAIWFHRPADFSDWLRYDQRSPNVSGGVGLGIGSIYHRDGTLVATVTQEGFIGRPVE